MFDVNAGHSYVDGEPSGSEQSIDDEVGIPSVVTPGVRKTRDVLRAPGSEPFHSSLAAVLPSHLPYFGQVSKR